MKKDRTFWIWTQAQGPSPTTACRDDACLRRARQAARQAQAGLAPTKILVSLTALLARVARAGK